MSSSRPDPQKRAFIDGEGDAYFDRNHRHDDANAGPAAWAVSLVDFVPPRSSVVEIGCGNGRNLAYLRSAQGIEAWGLDPSAAAIEAGRERWPGLTLAVGTADEIPFTRSFDVAICGFFLYLIDRALLARVIAEVDRLVVDGGTLAIFDFDPPQPSRRIYKHREGLSSFKMAYDRLFLALPHYRLLKRLPFDRTSQPGVDPEAGERRALAVLRKDLLRGYVPEEDRPLAK